MTLSKWQALGNAYLVTPPLAGLTAERVRSLVEDADGLLEVSALADDAAEVRVWNADGSPAEMSGNGTRIAAMWLARRTGARTVRIRVGPREVVVRMRDDGTAEQDMGRVVVGELEEVEGISFVPVDVGNPHAVVPGDPADLPWIGPALEAHPRFPNRTNVQVARVEESGEVTARVWERGVGETSASGTGAVAVAAAVEGDGETSVRFPGGTLVVRLVHGHAHVIGPAERIAD